MSARRVSPVDEVVCRLEGDGRPLRVFHCTPERFEDLGLGWLIGEGMVESSASPPRLTTRVDAHGVIVYADAIAGAWVDHDIARPEDEAAPVMPTPRAGPPADLSDAFRELYARASRYHDTGGIHAAAIVIDGTVVSHAEDVGRHNAVDKAIGAAARAGRALDRAGLVVTARVSGEMARKAATAGLAWIASRSLPTTLALSFAGRAGMTIVARAPSAEARVFPPTLRPLGVILAGGRNRRFGGRAKALEEVGGRRIIDTVAGTLAARCADVVIIANDADMYAEVELPKRPDARAGAGPVGGLREALAWARERGLPGALVVACDMPFVPGALLDALWRASEDADGAVAESAGPRGVEPLCAAYRTSCLPAIEAAIERGDLRVIGFFDDVDIRRLPTAEAAAFGDPDHMFFNVNTADELARARRIAAGAAS